MMEGIQKITARILEEAEEKRSVIEKEAAKVCREIRAQNEVEAGEYYRELMNEGLQEIEQKVSRIGRNAKLEGRKTLLSEKQRLVEEAFELSKKKLRELPKEEYIGFFSALAAEASVTGEEEIILSAEEKEALGAELIEAANSKLEAAGKKAALKLSEKDEKTGGGFIMRRGEISTNCTVESLVELKKQELIGEVAELLLNK